MTCTKTYSLPHTLTESSKIKATHLDLLSNLGIIHDHPRIIPPIVSHFLHLKNMFFFNPLKPFLPPPKKKISCLLAMVVWTKITETVQILRSHLKPRDFVRGEVLFCPFDVWPRSVLKIQNARGVWYAWKIGLKAPLKWTTSKKPPENRVDSGKERILYSKHPIEKVQTCAFQGGYSTKTSH